jgi:hypothetical protein
VRRITAMPWSNDDGKARRDYAELHTDGSGFVARPIYCAPSPRPSTRRVSLLLKAVPSGTHRPSAPC